MVPYRGGPAGWLRPPVATKLTQSPWFLKPGKVRQPPFVHCPLEVGSAGASVIVMLPLVIG